MSEQEQEDEVQFFWPSPAQEDHRCEWCGEAIPAGEYHPRYLWQTGADWRLHEECMSAMFEAPPRPDGSFRPFVNERGWRDPREVRQDRERAGQLVLGRAAR